MKTIVRLTSRPHIACAPDGGFTRFGGTPCGAWGLYMVARGVDAANPKRKCTVYWDKSDPAVVWREDGLGELSFALSKETTGNPVVVFDGDKLAETDAIIR